MGEDAKNVLSARFTERRQNDEKSRFRKRRNEVY